MLYVRVKPWQIGKKEWQKGVVQKRLDERSYEVELPQDVLRRSRVHLRKTNGPAPHELPTQAATEVDPPATPEEASELRRSQRARQVAGHHKDYFRRVYLFIFLFSI